MVRLVVLLCALVATTFAGLPVRVPQLDGRIVGGSAVTIDKYPHQISLQYFGSHICGGSIISSYYVLTAAHCTYGSSASSLSVRAGSSYKGSGGDTVSVSRINQHPSYNPSTTDYDICILTLSRALKLGTAIGLTSSNPSVGTLVHISGWGALREGGSSPNQLQAVSVPIVSQATCKAAYGSAAITDRMICAGVTSGGKDSCQGDSGGPMVAGRIQYGVVSWGYGCARPNYPGVYASVANLRSWIRSIVGF